MITKSQQHKAEAIKTYFEQWNHNRPLDRFELVKDGGLVWVAVETTDNVYTLQGGHYSITKRGSVRLHDVYDLCVSEEAKKERIKWYAEGVGGKVAR